jgi:hypothetical protein
MVRLQSLIHDLNRYVTLATFDVVVNLEGDQPTTHARIRVPDTRKDDIIRFCDGFKIKDVEVAPHSPGWVEITFPVEVMEASRGRW